jgi:hypothetical protein
LQRCQLKTRKQLFFPQEDGGQNHRQTEFMFHVEESFLEVFLSHKSNNNELEMQPKILQKSASVHKKRKKHSDP